MKKENSKKIVIGLVALILVVVLVFVYMNFFRTYSVYFDTKMGTSIKTQEIKKNEVAVRPSDPTSTGYKFIGWYLNDIEFDFNTKITENITLTAKWEKVSE